MAEITESKNEENILGFKSVGEVTNISNMMLNKNTFFCQLFADFLNYSK